MNDRINYYAFLPLAASAFLLETAFLPNVLGGAQLHIVMAVIFASVFLSTSSDFLYTAFVSGFLLGIYSVAPFGVILSSTVLAAVCAYFLKTRFLKEENFTRIAGTSAAAMILYDGSYLLMLALSSGALGRIDMRLIGQEILLDALFASVAVYIIMHLISNGKE